MTGFFPREHDAEWTWRWMGKDAAWTIVNTSAQPIVATLGIEMSAFHRARRMELLLDGRHRADARRRAMRVASTRLVRSP